MHPRPLRALAWVAATTLAAGLAAAPGHAAWAEPAGGNGATQATALADPKRPGTGAGTVLTLVTGDQVVLRNGRPVHVRPGPGRHGVRFASYQAKGHTYVIPVDTFGLIRANRLDRRLFDLTTLLELGYGDGRDLRLIVTQPAGRVSAMAKSSVLAAGATVSRELPTVGALAVRADADARAGLWRSLTGGSVSARTLAAGVRGIWLDGQRKISLDVSVPQIGAPQAWKAGFDGAGVLVAVVDTGIDVTHPDLKKQVVAQEDFTESPDKRDNVGHGTHVASTIAGTGDASKGRYKGVAPKAKLLDAKVCADEGCSESAILAGMAWAADKGAKVINMSLGGMDQPGVDPLEQAVEELTNRYGALFVVAAGNDGEQETVGSPASADAALAVGAVDRKDKLAEFSSRGPRTGDDGIKPEITAPGVDIVAARSKHGFIDEPAPVKGYTTLSGTSMATPHVAGAAAILTQKYPDWSPAQRKATLMGSAKPAAKPDAFAHGAGRVDVARAITQTVTTDPASVGFGRTPWPHTDDTPITRTLTYRNGGPADITLTLTPRTAGPDGKPAPKGLFNLSADSVTVPAGGTADVTVTADTAVSGPDGLYSGHIYAMAPGVRLLTPIGVHREVESYDVTMVHTDRTGAPTKAYVTVLINLETGDTWDVYDGDPTVVRRVPKGDYGMFSWIDTGNLENEDFTDDNTTMLVQPLLSVAADARLELDARVGKPVAVAVPHADATPAMIAASAEWAGENFGVGAGTMASRFDGLYTAQVGPDATVEAFRSSLDVAMGRAGTDFHHNSPYGYNLSWQFKGRMVEGFNKTLTSKDVATVRSTFARQAAGVTGSYYNSASFPGGFGGWSMSWTFDLPFSRTSYLNTNGGLRWSSSFEEWLVPDDEDSFPEPVSGGFRPDTKYVAGRSYKQTWNRAVFGPSLQYAWAARDGNEIYAYVPLLVDRDAAVSRSSLTKARTALYRNGKLVKAVAEPGAEFKVPKGSATYRLEQAYRRGAPHTLSTEVKATWTFKSARTKSAKALPLSVVRFTPELDKDNSAKAGRSATIGVSVQRMPDSAAVKNKKLTVEVSYNGGKTWKKVSVRKAKGKLSIVLKHPGKAGYVSLRATAIDNKGVKVVQTILRAYRTQ